MPRLADPRVALAVSCALLVGVAPARAQEDASFAVIDRIAAVVGDSVIPLSRIEEEVNVLRQQGGEVPTDSAGLTALRQEILRAIIDQTLLVQAALRDTMINVSEQEVQAAVERAVREVRGQFASDLEFRRQLEASNFGTPEAYRRWLADQQRRELLRNQLMQRLQETGQLVPLAPTDAELRAFFESNRTQMGRRPATITFRQVVVRVRGDSVALAAARVLADSLAQAIRNGADFGQVARRYSADPSTRDQGGELGWVRRGVLVAEFERVAFDPRMRAGTISPPVETVYGYHIIEVERAQPAEVQVRHILIGPELTEADRARALQQAEEVRDGMLRGEPFDSLARRYHDYAGQEQTLVEDFPRDQLPPGYGDALQGATPGDVIGPVLLDAGDGRPKYTVMRVDNVRPEGDFNFEDVRERLRSMLSEQNAMERYLRGLRDATYIEVRL